MRILFITYRWGSDLLGGAEIHHRRLAHELRDRGHEVDVWTTTAHNFRPFCHWGALWTDFKQPGTSDDEGIAVTRYRAKPLAKWTATLLAKWLQHDWERTPIAVNSAALADWRGAPLLGTDWHEAEGAADGRGKRWSHHRGTIHLDPTDLRHRVLVVAGHAPWPTQLTLRAGNIENTLQANGWFDLRIAIPEGVHCPVATFAVHRTKRPLREFRELGVIVERVAVESGDEKRETDFFTDARAIAADADFVARARRRKFRFDRMFQALRGPNSPDLAAALYHLPTNYDLAIACNFPWRIYMPRPNGTTIRALMPLMHLGDSYYYWGDYLDRIATADLVLANTPFSERHFRETLRAKAHFVGPPIWRSPLEENPRPPGDEFVVLTVSRKSAEKKYAEIAAAVAALRAEGLRIRCIGVGPDADGAPVPEGMEWLGRLGDDELEARWREADAFVLMSESESFGMVVVEAWHHGLPVVVNRRCAPVASLVADEVDGLLAQPGAELRAALRRLAGDAALRRRLGRAGLEKAKRDFVRGSAADRLLRAVESLPGLKR